MNFIYDYTQCGIALQKLHNITGRLSDSGFVLDAIDQENLAVIEQCIEAKQKLEVSSLWVIGIGGSNMGALAIYSALEHLTNKLPVYWVDTLDPLVTGDLLTCFMHELAAGKKPLVVIISKSGTTLETVVNANLFLDVLRKQCLQHARFVVAITDKDSALWQQAQEHGYTCLEIPKKIGGRYSVFTAVGLFSLGMLGISLYDLCAGALQAQKTGDSATQAAIIYAQYKSGKNIYDHFVFGPRLKYLGEWYRQLMGESLGKSKEVGITPTVSVGSIDLHSVVQLYLAGPHDKLTCFILGEAGNAVDKIVVPCGVYAGKTITQLQKALFDGTCAAYQKQELPFIKYVFELNAFNVGYFMQLKMIEMVHLAFLLGVNPFDQPEVELYKAEVRRILA